MRAKTVIPLVVAGVGLFVGGALAQHEEHHKDQVPSPTAEPPTPDVTRGGGMMASNMMSQMGHMMSGQSDAAKLVDQLVKSLAAIQAEKNPAALEEKLANHAALLRDLQTKLQGQSQMMDKMHQMMGNGMMGGGMSGMMNKGTEGQDKK